MALRIPQQPQLFKEGLKISSGAEEVTLRNIAAVRELSEMTRTSFGPNGYNKMVINHLEKLFVTNDAATIIRELEVVHPAAKLLVWASQQQDAEMGDATNFVVVLAGELLIQAEKLLRMGLHPSEIAQGYEVAMKKAHEVLEGLSVYDVKDLRNPEELAKAVRTAVSAKQRGYEELLGDLVVEAVHAVLPKQPTNFNVDSVRVVKILGGSVHESRVVRGMVFNRQPEGTIRKATQAKVAVFTCPLDISQTETKGTVLIHNADEMLSFTKGEEKQVEKAFKELADAGVKVVVTGSGIGELALHYLNRFDLLAIKVLSKFDLRRLCRVTGATALARLGAPTAEEMGYVNVVETIEIGSDRVTVFRQEEEKTKTSTVVLRGATQNHLDDLERAVDDGVNIVKALAKDGRLVPGAGATEMEVAKRLAVIGEQTPGLDQHAIKQYATAFEVIPRTLADNAGLNSTEVLSRLYAAHQQDGNSSVGVDIESEDNGTLDAVKHQIFDVLTSKYWALKLATDVALTVLRVDQIIMSKQAGGPKAPKQRQNFDEEE